MKIQLTRGGKTTIVDRVTTYKRYGYRTPANQFTADAVVEIDHNMLLALIAKAAGNKSKKSSDGPITVKVSNILIPQETNA
jgi:hypothetical protein